jgi:putative transposase
VIFGVLMTPPEITAQACDFIEMFYNPKKRHSHTGGISTAKFE